MVGVGVAWASTLSMPYAILAGALPAGKTGIYMGIFNFFIVIPEILAALGFGELLERVLTHDSAVVRLVGGDNRLTVVVLGGLSLAVAAGLCGIVTDPSADRATRRVRSRSAWLKWVAACSERDRVDCLSAEPLRYLIGRPASTSSRSRSTLRSQSCTLRFVVIHFRRTTSTV